MNFAALYRVAVTFFTLLLLTRLTGKKQLSQSTYFDFITALAVGDIAGDKLSDPDEPLIPWLAATALWFGLTIAMDWVVLKNHRLAQMLEGTPTLLIANGRILKKALAKEYLRVGELMAHLRKKGYFNPSDVEYAVFETDGTVSVLPKSQARSVTPRDMNIATNFEGLSHPVVLEGRPCTDVLKKLNLTESWLDEELRKRGCTIAQVFYASLDSHGGLFISPTTFDVFRQTQK